MAGNPVDRHVGTRMRARRTVLGFSQDELAKRVGVAFQQIQKYEKGTNRIGASRLFDIANTLNVPVGYFFEDMPDEVARRSPACLKEIGPDEPANDDEPQPDFSRSETLQLVRSYHQVKNRVVRQRILSVVRSLGASDTDTGL